MLSLKVYDFGYDIVMNCFIMLSVFFIKAMSTICDIAQHNNYYQTRHAMSPNYNSSRISKCVGNCLPIISYRIFI